MEYRVAKVAFAVTAKTGNTLVAKVTAWQRKHLGCSIMESGLVCASLHTSTTSNSTIVSELTS